jgi:hypothetical protein
MIKTLPLNKINLFEFAPSISWFFLMTVPFLYQYEYFNSLGRSTQFTSIFFITIFFFIIDFYCAKTNFFSSNHLKFARSAFFDTLSLFFILVLATHLCLMPNIPILDVLFSSKAFTSHDIGILRENSLKLLDVPQIFKYVLNWLVIIFCPISIVYFFLSARKKIAFTYLLFLVFYSIATTSKFPLFQFASSLFFIFIFNFRKFYFVLLNLIKLGLPLFLIALFFLLSTIRDDQKFLLNKDYYNASVSKFLDNDPRRSFSLADNYRSNYPHSDNKFDLNYFVYRVWLTPVDVSNRWFQFFNSFSIGFTNFWPFNRQSNSFTPAQSVGRWAFSDRFPDRYLDTASANASFDADAFSRFGIFGVIIGTLILAFFRCLSSALITKNPFSLLSYCIILSMLTILPFISSLQAIIGSHGLLIPIFIMMYFKFYANYRKKS